MKRLVSLTITIMVVALGCIRGQVDEFASVSFMIGDVKVNSASVEIGDIVKEKDIITTGSDSFCDVKIGSSIIRIKEESNVVLSSLMRDGDSEKVDLNLSIGKMICKPKKLVKDERFLVKTPTAVAGVRGTQFTVEADKKKTTRIKVYEGNVKAMKRIKQFEGREEQVLQSADPLNREQKVIITEAEVQKAEQIVDDIIEKEMNRGLENALESAILKARMEVVITDKDIIRFRLEDFDPDTKEVVAVSEKPKEVIEKIEKVIKLEKESPKPDGRLLVTRFEVYFIKNGRVMWEGKVINPPIQHNDKLYIASGNYVFCSSVDGPVIWRKNMQNEGKLQIREDRLVVVNKESETSLDLDTGQQL